MDRLIDVNEISHHQHWEHFAMAFLEQRGFQIVGHCAVGPDGGRDFIASERTPGGGDYRWLVSCKLRHTGSIGVTDDEAKANKLREWRCHGFMFVYSNSISQGLMDSIERTAESERADFRVYTDRDIENILAADPNYYILIRQYFPLSWSRLFPFISDECDCQDSADDLYLMPYKSPQTGQVEIIPLCSNCGTHKIESLEQERIDYGNAIVIRRMENY